MHYERYIKVQIDGTEVKFFWLKLSFIEQAVLLLCVSKMVLKIYTLTSKAPRNFFESSASKLLTMSKFHMRLEHRY